MACADIVIKSSTIFTAETLDTVEGALVICGDKIEKVCSREEAEAFVGPETQVIEAGDKLVCPGFNDSHTHFLQNGIMKDADYTLSLGECKTKEAVKETISAFAAAHPENKWIMGCDLNFDAWEDGEVPTRQLLDDLVPDRPAYFASWDMHVGWFNSLAIQAVGYFDGMADPDGARLGRDEDGRLNGLGYEPAANDPVWGAGNLQADMDRAIGASIQECLEAGITSVGVVWPYGGVPEADNMRIFQEFEAAGKLPLRVTIFPKLVDRLEDAKRYEKQLASDHVRFGGVKLITDGVTEAFTAFQTEPYANNEEVGCGQPAVSYDELLPLVRQASAEGYSVRLHCIGNGAVKQAIDVFEKVYSEQGFKNLHHCIEHIETICPEDLGRMAKLGIVASMQPIHSVLNVEGYPDYFDEKWVGYMWPIRSLLGNGVLCAFGSDAPVWSFNVMEGLYAAVERKQPWDARPDGGFVPEQRITLAQALQAYTFGAAYAENFENRIGTLRSGKLADVVVMDRNLFECEPEQLLEAKPIFTIVGGKIAYQA